MLVRSQKAEKYARAMPRQGKGLGWLVAWLILAALYLAIGTYHLHVPGPNYDECVQAGPARDFLEARSGAHIPSSRVLWILDRPFPLLTTKYMGALKSQVLIPMFGAFGSTTEVLRISTLIWSAIGLGFALYWANCTIGLGAAVLAGLLLVLDPSFIFISRHDWGSFSLGFLCRCGGLALLTLGWKQNRRFPFGIGGLFLGLGFYNKADFSVFFFGAGLGLLAANGFGFLREVLQRRRLVGVGLAFMALGAAPLLAHSIIILQKVGHEGGYIPLHAKLSAAWAVLDGSYFSRLMLTSGNFPVLIFATGATQDLFVYAVVFGLPVLATLLICRFGMHARAPAEIFILVAGLAIWLGALAIPGAGRAHHIMNMYPFPHWIVALTIMHLGSRLLAAGRLLRTRQIAIALFTVFLLASQARVITDTYKIFDRTGGRGMWTDTLTSVIKELNTKPEMTVVCLSWGFNEQFQFLGNGQRTIEPIFDIRNMVRTGSAYCISGDERFIYFLHDKRLDFLGIGPAVLRALKKIPRDAFTHRRYLNRECIPAFHTIQFNRPHRICFHDEVHITLF